MVDFNYEKAQSATDAIDSFEHQEGAAFLGGGTNLIDLMKYKVATPAALVDVSGLAESSEIRELPTGGIMLGAACSNAGTARHPLIVQRYPLLSKAILAGASGQIRNMATNGGNLMQTHPLLLLLRCSYPLQQARARQRLPRPHRPEPHDGHTGPQPGVHSCVS